MMGESLVGVPCSGGDGLLVYGPWAVLLVVMMVQVVGQSCGDPRAWRCSRGSSRGDA
ncbi:MAG: hypothetical protein HC884_02075 [Chloroflexaceae bacterium]|nr:hypothetical protein [Chloroflexaceae bacterium]